jgi:ammonium transporter, Amt family
MFPETDNKFSVALVSCAVIRERRILPFLVFIFLWSTFVYDPIARWTWSPEGWPNKFKTLDFAGGTAVHITAASTAVAYSFFFRIRGWLIRRLAPRTHEVQPDTASNNSADQVLPNPQNPRNVVNVVVGTICLWIGWFGFNGGSALGAYIRAVSACALIFVAAYAGGVTWCIMEYILPSLRARVNHTKEGRFSVVWFCNGVIAGFVAVTPAAGYVIYFHLCVSSKKADILSTQVSCRSSPVFGKVAFLDGYTEIDGGATDGNWKQFG